MAEPGICRVHHVVLEAQGEMKWNAAEQGERRSPVTLRGEQTFGERRLGESGGDAIHAARFYRSAQVESRIRDQVSRQTLSEQQRLVLATLRGAHLTFAAPGRPLTRSELDLLDVPGCTLAVPRLLPIRPVRIGESWDIDADTMAAFLGLSRVTVCDTRATFRRIERGVALIEITGEVTGRADGSGTRIELEAKVNFDLAARDVVWLAVSLKEDRDISDTQPGLELTARLRVVSQSHATPIAELSDEAIGRLDVGMSDAGRLVRVVSREGAFSLVHDEGWRVIVDRHDSMVLRLFDDGSLVGQLVVTPLADGPPGKTLALRPFQEEAIQALKAHSGQVVDSAEGKSSDGVRVLRVTATGMVSDVSMQWVYYHLSDEQGRRVGLTFTVQTDLAERFAERDRAMVETFRFEPREASQKAGTPAEKRTHEAGSGDTTSGEKASDRLSMPISSRAPVPPKSSPSQRK